MPACGRQVCGSFRNNIYSILIAEYPKMCKVKEIYGQKKHTKIGKV